MMFFWLKKLIVVFPPFIAAVFLYELLISFPSRSSYSKKLFQELSMRKNHPFQSTKNAIEVVHEPDEQIIIFITSAPFQNERRLSIRQTWLSLLVNNTIARGRSSIRTKKTRLTHLITWLSTTGLFADMTQKWRLNPPCGMKAPFTATS